MGEIGILRSLGCSNWKIYQLFIWESTLIALLSWGLATAMSYPLNWLLGWKIGESLLHSSMEPGISAEGSVYWLCASIFIGLIATILPVKKALGVNVKELL
nr:FtsX-like permease family protein [Bacillus sp. REN3]